MPLFQASVLKKYLNLQDKALLERQFKRFSKYFLDAKIQENIKNSKEEEYQGIFLTELFVNVLGYTLKPKEPFNLVAEYKNETNARKADGAILKNDSAIGVVELKSTKTKDLESIRKQAFDYKANQKDCVYVITSNFEKLRFYINDATEFIEFDLFNLSHDQFELLYLCLAKENIFSNLPLKIKEDSLAQEEAITKEFYKDYSVFKRELYRDLVKRNGKRLKEEAKSMLSDHATDDVVKAELQRIEKNVKLSLFKKSQKLIDRLLFIFFAEDRGLLPPNSTLLILEEWNKLKDLDVNVPLYERFKLYFKYLDEGREGTDKKAEIYAYNGGLFKPDTVLDTIELDDELLYKHTLKLANYDFESQVDVNILGHIFENSLNEIESVNAEIEGGEFDKQKSKRKKDGVFYTPKYITKYIVENTVGKLCEEKKQELGFKEEEYYKSRKGRQKATLERLRDILDEYREWLLQITICDPACGSGAFLNQALDFLISEHNYIDELKTRLLGGGLQFPDIENTVLEKNIFGVDLNEESVEIAKLSLWLRTAQPRRKLNDLSNNIKCGNSLIDSKAVAGDKAFNWQEEFPEIFAKGGFDVVIGNPPYVSNKDMHRHGMQNQISYWNNKFKSTESGNYDIFIPFIEQGLHLLNTHKRLSFIIPNKFLIAKYSRSLLELICEKYNFVEVIDYSNVKVFPGASVYPIIITVLKETKSTIDNSTVDRVIVDQGAFEEFGIRRKWDFVNLKFLDSIDSESDSVIFKIENSNNLLNDVLSFEPGINGFQFTNYAKCVTEGRVNSDSKKLIVTGTIDPHIFNNSITRYKKKDYKEPFITYDSEIISEGKWALFSKPKVMVAGMTKVLEASLDINGSHAPAVSVYSICGHPDDLYHVQLIINSKLINWFFRYKFSDKHMSGGYISVNNQLLKQIPFKRFENLDIIKELVLNANVKRKHLEGILTRLIDLIKSKFELKKTSKKLQNWNKLKFSEFITELNKARKALAKERGIEYHKLSLMQESEWMEYFNEQVRSTRLLEADIKELDMQIDQMVYELYGLTEKEIAIVENS